MILYSIGSTRSLMPVLMINGAHAIELHPDVISTPPSSHRYTQQAWWGASAVWGIHDTTQQCDIPWHLSIRECASECRFVCQCTQCEPIPWHEALMGHPLMSKCTPAWSSPIPNCWLDSSYVGWTETAWCYQAHLWAQMHTCIESNQDWMDKFH